MQCFQNTIPAFSFLDFLLRGTDISASMIPRSANTMIPQVNCLSIWCFLEKDPFSITKHKDSRAWIPHSISFTSHKGNYHSRLPSFLPPGAPAGPSGRSPPGASGSGAATGSCCRRVYFDPFCCLIARRHRRPPLSVGASASMCLEEGFPNIRKEAS